MSERGIIVKLTFEEKKTRFLFEETSPNVLVSTVGIRIKNNIDFLKQEKIFINNKKVLGRRKRRAAFP